MIIVKKNRGNTNTNFDNTKTATPTIRSCRFTLEAHPFQFSQAYEEINKDANQIREINQFKRSNKRNISPLASNKHAALLPSSLFDAQLVTCRDHRENERRLRICVYVYTDDRESTCERNLALFRIEESLPRIPWRGKLESSRRLFLFLLKEM